MAKDWPASERGDYPGQWYKDMARAELPLLSAEEREAVIERTERHEWMAAQRRRERGKR
jgi:hypothetical protein